MNDTFNPLIEKFSAYYDLVYNAEVHTYPEDTAAMDREMFEALSQMFGEGFIGMVGGLHYQFKPEKTVPGGAVAVPRRNHDEPETLLIQR